MLIKIVQFDKHPFLCLFFSFSQIENYLILLGACFYQIKQPQYLLNLKFSSSQFPNFSLVPHLIYFGTSQFKFAVVDLYYSKTIFTEEQPIFYPLTGEFISRQKTFAVVLFISVLQNYCKCEILQARLATIVQYNKYLFLSLFQNFSRAISYSSKRLVRYLIIQ